MSKTTRLAVRLGRAQERIRQLEQQLEEANGGTQVVGSDPPLQEWAEPVQDGRPHAYLLGAPRIPVRRA